MAHVDLPSIQFPQTGSGVRQETGWCLAGCLPPSRTMVKLPVDSEAFVIGRRPGVNLQLASQRVSGRHAEILKIGNHLFIRDLGSTNGTFVNRRRVRQPTPLSHGDHVEIADVEFRMERLQAVESTALLPVLKKTAQALDSLEEDWVMSQFDLLLKDRAITPHFQPLIRMDDGSRVGYEALARSPLCGLENPGLMFQTARIVNREIELSLLCRRRAVEVAHQLQGTRVFVNTHPNESLCVDVLPQLRQLREDFPSVRLVLEVHEGTVQNPLLMRDFANEIRDMGVELAYDDFGAGQARLIELVKAPPDYLKFDACLIRNIDQASPHQWRMLKMLVDMAKDFPTITLAEGVETEAEAAACRELGFTLGQGYLFGRPAAIDRAATTDGFPSRVVSI